MLLGDQTQWGSFPPYPVPPLHYPWPVSPTHFLPLTPGIGGAAGVGSVILPLSALHCQSSPYVGKFSMGNIQQG